MFANMINISTWEMILKVLILFYSSEIKKNFESQILPLDILIYCLMVSRGKILTSHI